MQQWRAVKARHPDSLVLFRVGDFYELFFEDAEEGARLLEITLTSRNNGSSRAPLAGIPVHALDAYLQRLIRLGRRVAICEQVEDPGAGKGIFRREVVETISPGTALNENLLRARRNNWLVAVSGDTARGGNVAVAATDLSTGELSVSLVPADDLGDWLGQLEPSEVLLPRSWQLLEAPLTVPGVITYRADWLFEAAGGREALLRHFGVTHLDGFGLPDDPDVVGATGALVGFLAETQPRVSSVIRPPRFLSRGEWMPIDEMTRRNLELVEPLVSGEGGRTLLDVLDDALTPMGGRLLRKWLLTPLLDLAEIHSRQEAVSEFVEDVELRRKVRRSLEDVRDLERLAVRIASGRCAPRDLLAVRGSLGVIPPIRAALEGCRSARIIRHRDDLDPLEELGLLVTAAISDDPPAAVSDGGVIREGFDPKLDELRGIRDGAVDWIAGLQARERERSGIPSLKIGFNKVFGYYIEVTRSNIDRVPDYFERRQTLANAERYVTPELKEWEEKVLGAEEAIATLEAGVFDQVRREAAEHTAALQRVAEQLAAVDVLAALAEVATRNEYTRPVVDDGPLIEIRGGRHPVVETMMPREEFIPNDVLLGDPARVIILTGPNMAGKSTILRQVGLIVLLAQVGAWVPAKAARIGVVDRIFTRVGASDNLVRGRSTFMVEMTETAAILNNATAASLVLLDEIGRGTSTWDGLSVATAVTEHLHDRIGAKTVFATHYHELTGLAERLDSLANCSVAVKEEGESIVFLRSLVRGGADRSYGVEVARLAGLPVEVVVRARTLLEALERGERTGGAERLPPAEVFSPQLGLFPAEHPALTRLRGLDVNQLTPIQALTILAELAGVARA
ncbi:MAG: DNA mismatch repair protein MutS [Gemmatimonadota bacterium]|nr:DNA mismatch repair protein MutS [Gemmatimonadota bacterium]